MPITPTRIVDSRSGVGVRRGVVPAGGAVTFQVTGRGGIEAGATNVVLNLTVVSPAASGWGTAYRAGVARPGTSNLNFMAGRTTARQVMVAPSASGQVTVFLSAAAQLIVDTQAYTPVDGTGYRSATPTRLLDTRSGAPYAANSTRSVRVLGRGGVPTSGVRAVVLSVIGTRSTGNGWLTAYPHGVARPGVSNLNTATGLTASTQALVAPGSNGAIDLYSAGRTDVVVDLVGYVAAGSNFVPVTPARVMDQRTGTGSTYGSNFTVRAPAGAVAAFVNLTAVGTASGAFTLQPGGTPVSGGTSTPSVSHVNFSAGRVSSNPVLIGLGVGSDAALDGYSTSGAKAIVDVFGYLVSPVSAALTAGASTTIPASYPYGMSCPTDGSCALLDYFGRVHFSQPDGSWRATTVPSQSLRAIACSSADHCVVTDETHEYVWDGSTWTTAPGSAAVVAPVLACASDQQCVLVGNKQGFTSSDGLTWTAVPALANLDQPTISCSSSTACLVADRAGIQVQWDGSSWVRSAAKAPANVDSLSCAGSTCVAVTTVGGLWSRAADGMWKQSGSYTSDAPVGVHCLSNGRCLAVGGSLDKVYDGSSWSDINTSGERATTLDCTAQECTVGWASGRFSRWDGTALAAAFQPVQWWLGARTLACASQTTCFTASGSWIQKWDGSQWSGAMQNVGKIGCLSATLCFSADGQQWTPATGWTSSGQPAGSWGQMWCEPGGMCAMRTSTAVYATAGHGWIRLGDLPDVQNLVGVSCPTTSWCMLQGDYGASVVWRGSGFQPAGGAIDGNHAVVSMVTCTSSTWCVATATGGSAVVWNGREWHQSKLPSVGISPLNLPYVHCDSATSCIVGDPNGAVSVWNGRFWSQPIAADVTGFDCVGAWCMGMSGVRSTTLTPFTYAAG
ncbi:hypothetical protein [Branchiibius hedensis]|uniref:hypothetical protein n=1 Tax=Branchiibius hedensis TaxID=672460 RepID=UPI000D6D0D44|nr:hypothetical protein [Branchiibius hedensis]